MTLETLRNFFLYCTLINFGMMTLATAVLAIPKARAFACKMHSKWFSVNEADINLAWYKALALYKSLVMIFCLVPYLALLLMR
jgi:Family of unknown function (DUF6868)